MEHLTERVHARICHTSRKWSRTDSHPSDCVRAYDVFAHQRDGCVKAVFDFR